MRVLASLLLGLLFLFCIPFLGAAQKPDLVIHFKTGKFTPAENANRLSKDSSVFKKSVFKNRHFVAIQFQNLPDENTRRTLKAAGIEIMEYISGNTYTASIKEGFNLNSIRSHGIRSLFQLGRQHKASPEISSGKYPAHAVKETGFVDVNVITYALFTRNDMAASLQSLGVQLIEEQPMFRTVILRVPLNNLSKLIEEAFVQWVEPIDPPNEAENLLGRSLHNANVLNDGVRNLKGNGVKIGIWDGGEVDKHLDFSAPGRLLFLERGSTSSHGTHVAGTVGSAGLINPKARGMAPNATLYSADFTLGTSTIEIYNAVNQHGLSVSSHSYGGSVPANSCNVSGSQIAYSATSRNTDITLNVFPNHLHVHSAGNSQTACPNGFYTVTGSGKSAKNNIVVANIQSNDAISGSSSFGPVHDGRIKPEISGFGSNVLSTYTPNNTYASISGTSMSTPGISGTLALLVERYRQLNSNTEPLSSLIKGLVCNTATDLGNPGPDYRFGFGKINALAAVRAMEENRFQVSTVATGGVKEHTVSVPSGAVRLKAMLTWNDPAASTNTTAALVNNLDLSVIGAGGSLTLPWVLNPTLPANNATRAVDNISNIEQVTVDNPAAGEYNLRVAGTAIASGTNQQYTLTWVVEMPGIEITYPNGGESFDPADAETISWSNAGVTGNQTIQYSIDNGATWITLSSTVPATTTRFAWTVPGVNTAQAKIRVSSDGISDESDQAFSILGTPKGLTQEAICQSGAINLKWTAVNNATHYDLLRLNDASGQWEAFMTNITGTAQSISGLTGGRNYWFSLVAKNNTNGSVSERSIGVEAVASNGNLAAPGAITGVGNVCSNTKNISFSISPVEGATSYIWKAPAGATIVNGQGTTSVVLDFGANAFSGQLTVYASNGVCQTSRSEMTISITAGPALSVSAANPSICAPASTTLTASAPGSTGTVYSWSPSTGLSTTSGATVIASPTETTIYTVVATNPNGCSATASTTVYVANASNAISSNTPVCGGSTLQLSAPPAVSNKYASLKISEVVQFRDATGATPVYPFYVPSPTGQDDMLEISNVDSLNAVDVSGVTFELWVGTGLNRSYVIPNGVVLPPNQTMVIYVGSAGADNPEYRFYRTGGSDNPVASATPVGWLLRSASIGIIDVVATNSYTWPLLSGVTSTHWSGTITSTSGLAGIIRTAAIDNNLANNWAVASGSLLQSIGTYNNGYRSVSPYIWSGPGGFVSTEQNPVRMNVSSGMAGTYTVTYNNGNNGCVTSQSTTVAINASVAPAVTASVNTPICIGGTLQLTATSSDPTSSFSWTGPNGFTSSEQHPSIQNVSLANAGNYVVSVNGGGCTQTASVAVTLKQLKGIYKIGPGADYNSLTSALADYNKASCIQGPVVFEILNSYTPAFESFPITINNSPGASDINTLTIRPAVGARPQILSLINGDAVIRLNGARYVTIDGRINSEGTESALIIENLSTSALAGTSAITLVNGAQFNTVTYVKVLNGGTNGGQAGGNILFGSSTTVGNSNNIISNCFLSGSQESQTQMRYGIVCDGSNVVRNHNNTISGNEFYSAVFRGMPLNAGLGNNWKILNNHFYWQGGTFSTGGPRPIVLNNLGSSGHTISGNYIGGSEPNALGSWAIGTTSATTWYGMDLNLGTAEVTTITNNIIRNVDLLSGATSYGIIGMGLFSGSYKVTGNTISDLRFESLSAAAGANSLIGGIYYGNIVANNQFEASNNTIFNLVNASSTSNTASAIGIVQFAGAGEVSVMKRNKIYNLSIPNTQATGSTIAGMSLAGSSNNDVLTLENNMISLGQDETKSLNIFGINNTARVAQLNAFFNSVSIAGTVTSGANNSGAFSRNGLTNESVLNMKNNLFNNSRTGGTGRHYAVIANQTTPANGWSNLATDFNNYYSANPGTVALWGTTVQSFNDFKAATGADVNSRNLAVVFENTKEGNLSIKGGDSNCGLDNLGTPITGITSDHFNNTRSETTPDMGAHEFSVVPAPVETTVAACESYTWYGKTYTASGKYTHVVSTPGACDATMILNLTINPKPEVVVAANGPTAFCPGGSVDLTASEAASYKWSNGSTTQTLKVSTSGEYTVTITDANGCTATSSAVMIMADDVTPPTVVNKNIIVQLNASGTATITAAQINNGSTDNCTSPADLTLALDKTSFNCNNVGANTVTLTATDASGNTSTNTATVTVEDKMAPIVITKSVTVQLDANGIASITTAQVNNGSSDNCTAATDLVLALNKTSFTCANVGANTVILTVTDVYGNTNTAPATVMVEDKIKPAVMTNNITVQLNASGTATITAAQINNGSTDNCSIPANGYSIDKTGFTCANVGVNTVTLTVTDVNGNTNTAIATVTVEDKIAPLISCPTVPPVQCFNPTNQYPVPKLTATDNCSIATISFAITGATVRNSNPAISMSDNATGTFNEGSSTIAWTVTDVNGNVSRCTTQVVINPRINMSIPDVFAVNPGGAPNTIYRGYGPDTLRLSASASGGTAPYSYKWTIGSPSGPAMNTNASILVKPSATTTYSLAMKDVYGCAATAVTKTVEIVDVRCGPKMDRVTVCALQKGVLTTQCVTLNNVAGILSNGGYLGACKTNVTTRADMESEEPKAVQAFTVKVLPNPSTDAFTLITASDNMMPLTIRVLNTLGALVEMKARVPANGSLKLGVNYRPGVYYAEINQGAEKVVLKLIKQAN